MTEKRFDKIDEKLEKIEQFLSQYRVTSEKRITKIETVQKGFLALLGTSLASFLSVIVYFVTGGSK